MKKYSVQIAFTIVCLAWLGVTVAIPSDQTPAAKQAHPIALVGGTVHTVSGNDIQDATLLFDKGRIAAIGKHIVLPENVELIDVKGKHIYPGLISANTSLGLVEVAAVRSTRDYAEVGDINPNVRAEASFNPDSELLPVTRANGIALALSVPQGGIISGTSALMMLDGWTWEDMTFKTPVALHLNWPGMFIRRTDLSEKEVKKRVKNRDEKLAQIRNTFARARAYQQAKNAESQEGVPYHDTDLRWEAMLPVLSREIPVFVHANGIHEIQAAVDWALTENVLIAIVGGYDAWRVSALLKAHNIPVVVTGTHRTPRRRWENYDGPFALPGKLHEAGVLFCIATGGGGFGSAHERNLPYHSAMAAAYGLPEKEALKAVTLYPAQILGVADRLGSLEKGKDATLIVTDGDPLEIMTHVEMSFIQGRKIDLSSRHTQLYEKYKTKYERMGLSGN